uniref:Uncharacterized protein n=1 Tax=Microcebus murinus TaxID=30608 RepID=A0A8C5Y846_MICMU
MQYTAEPQILKKKKSTEIIAQDSLQPPQEVFIQGSAKCQGGVAALDANNWPQHIPREKVEKRKKAQAQQALPCCLIQEISPKHLC